jgi:hypothetical protein
MAETPGKPNEHADAEPETRTDAPSMSPRMRALILSFDSKDRRSKHGRMRPKNGRRKSDQDT